MTARHRHWFKAKDSGLGWSRPLTWQGWVVYFALFGTMGYFLLFGQNIGEKLLGTWVPIIVSLPIFWVFGEPMSRPRNQDPS